MRDSFRQTKKQNAENDVNGEKLNAFDPVGFAVAADLKQDVNRSDYGEDFRPRKLEVHRLTKQIGDEYQQRRDKERDLQAAHRRLDRQCANSNYDFAYRTMVRLFILI